MTPRDRAEQFVDDVFMIPKFDEAGRPRAALSRDELVEAVAELLGTSNPDSILDRLFGRREERAKPVDITGFLEQLIDNQGQSSDAVRQLADALQKQTDALKECFGVLNEHTKFIGSIAGETESLAMEVDKILQKLDQAERREFLESLSHSSNGRDQVMNVTNKSNSINANSPMTDQATK